MATEALLKPHPARYTTTLVLAVPDLRADPLHAGVIGQPSTCPVSRPHRPSLWPFITLGLIFTQSVVSEQQVDDSAPAVGRPSFPLPAALATFQLRNSPTSPLIPKFDGPYSWPAIEERIADYEASVQSLSHVQYPKSPGCWEGDAYRQCSGIRDIKSLQSQNHSLMSQRPATSGPQSNPSYHGGYPYTARNTSRLPPIVSTPNVPSSKGSERGRNTVGGSPHSAQSPREPARPLPSTDLEQSGSRTIKMHNILNPPNLANDMLRQRVASQADASPVTVPALSRNPSGSSPESSSRGGTPGITLPLNLVSSAVGHGNHRMATPSSLIRAGVSVSGVNMPSATIDAKETPFLPVGAQVYGSSTGPSLHAAPHLGTTPTIAPRLIYGYPPRQTNTPPDHRAGETAPQAPPSQGNSPSTSYSSYSHPSHASPVPQYTIPASQAPTSMYYGSLGPTARRSSTGAQITLGSDSSYGPVTSAGGQSTYQLMTLDTDQGPIQVPVDVQAASKMADEKRKRNAGASARFRQRRKEKEREASTTITKLETQIRELSEEREYYRIERDYFRGIVYSTSAQGVVIPRLPSPRQRKAIPGAGSAPQGEAQWEQSEERGGQTGRNTRRRINSYTPTYELPPPTVAAQSQAPAYCNPSPTFTLPKSEPRAPTPLGRSALPPGPQRFGPFDPSGIPAYGRTWPASQ